MSQIEETTRRILWVDDEIEFLRAHILFLQDHGWIVDTATNGHDALAMSAQQGYDVVLLDEQMAGIDGLTTLHGLKKANPSLFVVMCTKSEEERVMEEAIGKNIDGYLTKPVNPNQIVNLCRSLFNARSLRTNHLTSRYVRQYAENKARLMGSPVPGMFEQIHLRLAQWDLDLSYSGSEGLLETHRGQHEEAEGAFTRYIEGNWYGWMGRERFKPPFVWDFLPKRVVPRLREGQKAVVLVLSGLRTDQWLAMQSLVEGMFEVKVEHQWSLLPGIPAVARLALFGAASQKQLASENAAWSWTEREAFQHPEFLRALLKRGLGPDDPGEGNIDVEVVVDAQQGRSLARRADALGRAPLTVVVYEWASMLRELPDEGEPVDPANTTYDLLRHRSRRLLAHAGLYHVLRRLHADKIEVILTADTGSILVDEAIEVFCNDEGPHDFRVQFGREISCDERHAIFLENPASAGLDASRGPLALAKGARFFTHPNKYQYYGTAHQGRSVSGGLTMSEMLVPLCTLSPR